ncbi:tetratricopeptide repeat protein [Bradyrhizobium sp. 31Argb]|uniref:tetratricopeptide repeat protein n=1 Tax=Bradyrhizobium sp. 31Argb TaxID=3141247 RepID=UPI003748E831
MKIGLAQRRVLRGIAFLSVLWPICSAVIASDAQTYQTAAAVAVSKLDFERAIRRAYSERGFFYHHQSRFELALADYTAGAKLFSDDGTFPNGQGLALMELGQSEEAIHRFDEAIKLDPTSGVFMLGRAEAYNRSHRPQTALEDYDKALALGHLTQNDTYRLRVGVGAAHLTLKNEKAAIESLDKAVELRPNSTTALRYRGLAYERAGELDRAYRDYEAVLRLKPGDEFAVKRLQRLRLK